MKNLVRGPTRNREVQGWDDKIIHFFLIKILYNLEKIFYKEIIKKNYLRGFIYARNCYLDLFI